MPKAVGATFMAPSSQRSAAARCPHVQREHDPLSHRQKRCSTLVTPSLEGNRETQAFLAVRKRETIGQLCSDSVPGLLTKITIGLLENGLEPQATKAQEPFITPIFAIDQASSCASLAAGRHECRPYSLRRSFVQQDDIHPQ
jgi:hypothetical protein